MQKFFLGCLTLSTAAWIAGDALGHGGTYRGPGDTVPPGAGAPPPSGGPPTTGSPQGPAPQAPTGPTTPAGGGPPIPGAPPSGGKGPTTPSGNFDTETDLTLWSFWWEFNKEPFINLKAAIHSNAPSTGSGDFFLGDGEKEDAKDTLKPSAAQIRGTIVPALLRALENESNNDIVTGCLIALAKIGDEPGEDGRSQFSEVIAKFLADPNQEISETAALSLGILANASEDNLGRLIALMTDSPEGRKERGNAEQALPLRTRAFAAYGLGLVGYRAESDPQNDVRGRLVQEFADALMPAEREATQDLAAAIVISMGLVPLEPIGDSAEATKDLLETEIDPAAPGDIDSLEKQIALLTAIFDDLRLDRYMRAHIPTALGRMLESLEGRSDLDAQRRVIKRHVADMLLLPLDPRKGGKFEEEIQQSCALALGLVGDADQDDVDVDIRKTLEAAYKDQQRQAKNFALIALSKIAARRGEEIDAEGNAQEDGTRFGDARADVVSHLLKRLKGGKSGEEHYAGIGIGVMSWLLRDAGESPDAQSITLLHDELAGAKAVEDIGAFSVASGLAGSEEAKGALQKLLVKTQEPVARGYVALSLGMLNIRESQEIIRNIVESSEYKPDLLKQAAIALGLLGDKETVPVLIDMLKSSKSLATQASLASALGFIGDRRSVDPLVEMLEDTSLTETARGFAAVALGIVADKEPLPWNTKIGVDLNYRASLPTLNTQDGKGVLNIL